MILLAGAVLITPGVLTDLFGFLCLIPLTRGWIKSLLWRWFKRAVQRGQVRMSVSIRAGGGHPPHPPRADDPELPRPPDRRLKP